MSLKEVLGLGEERKVRYGIVALGDISQEAMMPGFDHTGNSKITALVSNDPEKLTALSEKYSVANTYSYDRFPQMLASGEVDAIYLAMPNWRHTEFAVPALEAGIHVLLEKPMEVTSDACLKILEAQKTKGAKLMIAYRLHFEPATGAAIEKGRAGELGKANLYTSTFGQMMDPALHRTQSGWEAGPVLDMGPYPINSVRNLFEAEPTEAFAVGTKHPESGFDQSFDDTVSVTLKFPENRLAQFTMSYYVNMIQKYTILGTEGSIEVNPGFNYGKPMEHFVMQGQKESHESFKNTDHFGGELKYFSQCILDGQEPEPDGLEGLADVRVIEAIHRSLNSGQWEKVEQTEIRRRISPDQVMELRAQSAPELVNTKSPMAGQEKTPKN